MNIKQIKEQALQILDAYSENGYVISESKPEKADYILRINGLINQALLRIITVYPYIKRLDLEGMESESAYDGVHYILPQDFLSLNYIKKRSPEEWGEGEFTVFAHSEYGKELITPYLPPPICYYSALPALIEGNASEQTEIDVHEAGARLIPLYVAGMLILEESPSLSTRLLNQFEAMLAQRIGEGVRA